MILDYLLFAILIFLNLIQYLIIIEVILSWTRLFGVVVRIRFIENTTKPIYMRIRKVLPTTFGILDFTPVIAIILIQLISNLIIFLRPDVLVLLQ